MAIAIAEVLVNVRNSGSTGEMKTLEDYLPLDGLGLTYSEEEARKAVAIAEAIVKISPGGGGEGDYIPLIQKGAPGGVAELAGNGFVPDDQIPSNITRDSELGAVNSALSSHANDDLNPHSTTAAQVGALSIDARGAVLGVAPLAEDIKLPEQYLPDNISVNMVSVPQGTTSELDAAGLASNNIALDITENRLRLGPDNYAKYSEVLNKSIVPPFISGNYYPLTAKTSIKITDNAISPDSNTIFEYFIVNSLLNLSSISIQVITTANTDIALALYSLNGNLKPTTRLTSPVTLSCLVEGWATITVSAILEPGIYAIGNYILGDGNNIVLCANPSMSEDLHLFGIVNFTDYSKTVMALSEGIGLPANLAEGDTMIGSLSDFRFIGLAPVFFFQAA
ncbi:hypothetical protein [Anabaena lutea]|uniref:Uncharacterized protein n=1 Tax=Anabaena lutea FACHB-196 TaxID=2692881 RepID=A0ABR8FKE0_9NOST|nr:hypothetical protein [Anabaena lutea]MBD2570053.1 hypothetical protein [Anabaena lutea FACHB-196]